jgi:hypothetical protein
VRSGEELVREDRQLHATLPRPLVRSPDALGVCSEDHHRLAEHGQVAVARAVGVGLADDLGDRRGDAADKKRGDVHLLPGDKVLADDDGDLRVETHFP